MFYKIITAVSVFLMLDACIGSSGDSGNKDKVQMHSLKVGDKDDPLAKPEKNVFLLKSGSRMCQCYEKVIDHILYRYCKDDSGYVNYIIVRDKKFRISDSIMIGTKYKYLTSILNDSSVHLAPGWAFYVELKDGWSAKLSTTPNYENKIKDDDEIVEFFQRQ